MRRRAPLWIALLLASASASGQDPSMLALDGLDPVELCGGKEVAGDPGLTAEHFVFLYRFASEKNREAFKKDPERWGVQMGGACGRMGPGSGRGDPERYFVHDGRVYLFASEQCRDAFKKKPEVFVDVADAPVEADAASAAKARELLDLAAKAHGGADRIAALKSLRFLTETKTKLKDGAERADGRWEIVDFARGFAKEAWYGPGWKWRTVRTADPAGSFEVTNKGQPGSLHASAALELLRVYGRRPLVMLRERGRADFKAGFVGEGKVGETAVAKVATSFAGVTTTFAIDPASGLVVGSSYRGRGPQSTVGAYERTFSDFRDVGGLKIPFKTEGSFDGKAIAPFTWTAVETDVAVDPALFVRPKT